MQSIRDITALIRSAIYGRDVRENIALGIEKISDREDVFEQNINNSETTRQTNENLRQSNENIRQSNETSRTNAEIARVNVENTRVSAENVRKANEDARVLADSLRQSEWSTFKNQNTMMDDLYVRKAVLIPTKTTLTVSRVGLAFNPLNGYSPASLTTVANNTFVDNGMTKDNLCYYSRNQIRGSDSILFKTINEHILNGAEVI